MENHLRIKNKNVIFKEYFFTKSLNKILRYVLYILEMVISYLQFQLNASFCSAVTIFCKTRRDNQRKISSFRRMFVEYFSYSLLSRCV